MTRLVHVSRSPLHGRGLFASAAIAEGTQLAQCPLLILSCDDTASLSATRLHHYVFWIRDEPDGRPVHAVAFGVISMCNHSRAPNAAFSVDAEAETVTLTARTNIAQGNEILIDYGDFADQAVG
jgi:hypothetical protein